MTEEIRENETLNLSPARRKRERLYRRFLNSNPRFVADMGLVGVYSGIESYEIRSTEEYVRLEGGDVVVPIFGDLFSVCSGLNPSVTAYPRRNVRKPSRPKKKKKNEGGKK